VTRIKGYVDLGGVALPFDRRGRLLDPKSVVGPYAEPATSPYGPRKFRVGTIIAKMVLDFIPLPDGRVVLTASEEPGPIGLPPDDWLAVPRLAAAGESAYRLTERCLDALRGLGMEHDERAHEADAWYFMRAVCKHTKVKGYCDLSDHQLRFGVETT